MIGKNNNTDFDEWMNKYHASCGLESEKCAKYINQNVQQWFDTIDDLGLNQEKRDIEIIVSLTTIPSRIAIVSLPIKCMLHQTMKPDRILLYLANDEFAENELPRDLLELKEFGLEILFVDNMGSHKKYLYTMQKYSDAYIITIDDDILYSQDMIRKLFDTYEKNYGCICTMYANKMRFTDDGIPYPYKYFTHVSSGGNVPSFNLLAGTGGGTLFPPNCFQQSAFDEKMIKEIAYWCDDIWLKAMELIQNIKVVRIYGDEKPLLMVDGSQTQTLFQYNGACRNDVCLKNIFEEFDLYHFFRNEKWKIEDKEKEISTTLEMWLENHQRGIRIDEYLSSIGIRNVAIYGIGRLGRLLLKEFDSELVDLKFAIDKNCESIKVGVPVTSLYQMKEKVDLIIITPVMQTYEIKKEINKYTECKIITITDLLVEMRWNIS